MIQMLEALLAVAYLAGVSWIAFRSFQRPRGVYLKSLISFVVAAGAVYLLLSSLKVSNEAGLGVFLIFCIAVALAAFAAIAACIAASVRYACNAMATGGK